MFKKVTGSFVLALHNIRSNFFHTILSLLGIVIGVAALVSILSLIDGMEKYAKDEITKTTSLKAITVASSTQKKVNDVWIRRDSVAYLTYDDFTALKSSISVPSKAFIWHTSGRELLLDSTKTAAHATGVSSFDTTFHVLAGRNISDNDIMTKKNIAVVTKGLADILAAKSGYESLIGKVIQAGDRKVELVGVVHSSRALRPELFFPFTLITPAELKANPAPAMFEAQDVTEVAKIKEQAESWLAERFGDKNNFIVTTNEFRVAQAARGFKLFRIIMGLIVGISVLVGGIGVMNVLLISVTERTSEIGVRKAVGANKRDIVLQFLSESITISLFGSLLGLLIGILATMAIVPIINSVTGAPFQAAYTINTLVVISVLAVIVGIVFGTYPAIRAARLDPVEAIRREG